MNDDQAADWPRPTDAWGCLGLPGAAWRVIWRVIWRREKPPESQLAGACATLVVGTGMQPSLTLPLTLTLTLPPTPNPTRNPNPTPTPDPTPNREAVFADEIKETGISALAYLVSVITSPTLLFVLLLIASLSFNTRGYRVR